METDVNISYPGHLDGAQGQPWLTGAAPRCGDRLVAQGTAPGTFHVLLIVTCFPLGLGFSSSEDGWEKNSLLEREKYSSKKGSGGSHTHWGQHTLPLSPQLPLHSPSEVLLVAIVWT